MKPKTAILVVLCVGLVSLMALVATLTPSPVTNDHYHTDTLNHEPLGQYHPAIRGRSTGTDTNLFQLGDGTVVCIMRVTPKTK